MASVHSEDLCRLGSLQWLGHGDLLLLSPSQSSPHFLKSSLIAYVLVRFLWVNEADKFVNIFLIKIYYIFKSVHPFEDFFGLFVVSLTLCLSLFTQLPLAWLDSLHLTLSLTLFLSVFLSPSVWVRLGNMHGLDHRKFDCTVMSQAVSRADWWGDGGTAIAVGTGSRRWQEGWQKLWETAVMPPGLLQAFLPGSVWGSDSMSGFAPDRVASGRTCTH